MLSFTAGDWEMPMRAVVRREGTAVDVSSGYTFTGFLIYQDGTRVPVVPIFDPDAVGDGTDGAVIYYGILQASVPVGLHTYQFFATSASSRLSTTKIPFRVLPNA